jgi:hypothetical protein
VIPRPEDGLYRVGDLLAVYWSAREPIGGSDRLARFYWDAFEAFCKAFSVSLHESSVPEERREALRFLKTVLERVADVPHPTKDFLEDSLVNLLRGPEMMVVGRRCRDLVDLYRKAALEAAAEAWGDRGARTEAQLRACGLRPEREWEVHQAALDEL